MTNRSRSSRRYLFGILIAVELLMSFSFFGYIHVEPISITIAYIPVLLAGALTGPLEALVLGAVFGLASMWKASATYVMASDQLFSPLLSGDPFASIFLSVGSRMLFGLITGLFYYFAKGLRKPGAGVFLVSFFGRLIHSLMVYSTMGLFFPEAGFGPADAFSGFFSLSNLTSNLATALIVFAFWLFFRSKTWRQFQNRLELSRAMQTAEPAPRLALIVSVLLTLAAAIAVTLYFVHRIDYVLQVNGIALNVTGYADVLHLQIQFLFGIISLMVLVILFFVLNRQYNNYMAYEAKLDSLTGLMTRRAFFPACSRTLQTLSAQGTQTGTLGYFIMVDLDYFKTINDTLGHPEGDRALREVAKGLKECFDRDSHIGRLGGDEFAVLVCTDMAVPELEVKLRHFLDRFHRLKWKEQTLGCSIGALPVHPGASPEKLYLETDRLLYAAKEQGRNQYVIGS